MKERKAVKLAVLSFTAKGCSLNAGLCTGLRKAGMECTGYTVSKFAESWNLERIEGSLRDFTGAIFGKTDGLIFIGACGIAVRSIAPFVQDKFSDPAVLVIDEGANFVISLLSGHVGGANDLARLTAEITGAVPVISTATDVNGKFAVDEFAVKNHLVLTDRKLAKEMSAAVLEGKMVGLFTELEIEEELNDIEKITAKTQKEKTVSEKKNSEKPDSQKGLVVIKPSMESAVQVNEALPVGAAVTIHRSCRPFEKTLRLVPRILYLGIGCKKDTPAESIEQLVTELLQENNLCTEAIAAVCSIDIKKEEKGLLAFCRKHQLPFFVFSAEELKREQGDFSTSAFVQSVTGVDNVCERAAVSGSGQGQLIVKKVAKNGVTAAIAVRKRRLYFE